MTFPTEGATGEAFRSLPDPETGCGRRDECCEISETKSIETEN